MDIVVRSVAAAAGSGREGARKQSKRVIIHCRWLGTALDGQTDCVKTNRIRLSVVNPSAVLWLGTTLNGRPDRLFQNQN